MGWQLTTTVVRGQRYRFVVQQPTSGKWSGDVQGSLEIDWGFDLVGNNFEIDQVGSSGTWVGQGSAARSWTVPLSPQTVGGFTYLAVAAQARDDLTRLVHASTSYTFDVRTPTSWTTSQVAAYLQSKGWSNVQVAAASDVVSLLAGLPDSVASTTAFAVTATWTGADKTSISDLDGTISYGAFSGQPLLSVPPTVIAAASTSSATPWLIGLGVVGALGLGLVLLSRSKPTKNPDYPVIECRIVRRPPPFGPWSLVMFIYRGSTTQQKIVDSGDDVNALAEVGRRLVPALAKHAVNNPHAVQLFDHNGKCIFAARNVPASMNMVPFSSWDVVPCETSNPRLLGGKLLSGAQAAKLIAKIPMYRGARQGDPRVLAGPSYFSSNEGFAKTYGPTVAFHLELRKPLVVSNADWFGYSSSAWNTIDSVIVKLEAEGRGYDSVVTVHKTFVGPMYTVFLADPSRATVVSKNPRGIFIYDLDALDKLAELEGRDWLADDERMWKLYRSGTTAHAFQFAWWYTHKPGVLGPQDLPFWKDYFAGDPGIELSVIYGNGGYARFSVTDAGEIVLSASSTRPEKADRAEQLGFRVLR